MSFVNVSIIFGRAGTGKSTVLAEMVGKCIGSKTTFVVLTSTHSSLNNIYSIVNSKYPTITPREQFKTIYSFFRIDYENEIVAGCKDQIPNYIFIDEFSLINKHLFKKILRSIKVPTNMILVGDVLQLNAIYNSKQYISLAKLKKYKNILPNVIEHIHLSLFGIKSLTNCQKRQLTTNHRNSSFVTTVLNNIYNRNIEFNYPFVDDLHQCVALIDSAGYTFLSSKYKHIQRIYDYLSKGWHERQINVLTIKQDITYRFGLKRIYLYPDLELMLTVTARNLEYYNGEYVKYKSINDKSEMVCINSTGNEIYIKQEVDTSLPAKPKYYPVIPKSLITIHKSQGQTIKNIIVCIDDLFDMCMLYTAITRSQSDVKFFTNDNNNTRLERLFESAYINDFKQLNSVLNQIVNESYVNDKQ